MAEVSLEHGHAFHLAIPVAAETAAALGSVRIERDGQVLAERAVGIRTSSVAPTEATLQPDGSVAIVWDAAAFEEVLVRDGEGGPVLGRDRTGAAERAADERRGGAAALRRGADGAADAAVLSRRRAPATGA